MRLMGPLLKVARVILPDCWKVIVPWQEGACRPSS